MPQRIRWLLVQEILNWQKEGIISEVLAEKLKGRYDFDFRTPPPAEHLPVPLPIQPVPPPAPKPRLTLAQTLLSETSIKIALYLGAFFVISASLILAALVATLRLPILLTVTAFFAVGALVLKRRLPQPSFILYLVFSTLLPISAGVLADMNDLVGKTVTGYWLVVMICMALIWAFSTWLYISRFFSLMAFLALDTAMVLAGSLMHQPPLVFFLLLLTFSSLAGLAGSFLLKHWQGKRIALPVFILAQVQQGLILLVASALLLIGIAFSTHEWGLISASTWLLTSAFAVISHILFPFFIYPWIVAGALMPIAWLVVGSSDNRENISALTLSIWGMLFSIAGEILHTQRGRLRLHSLPTSVAAIPLLVLGAGAGFGQNVWLGFSLFLGTSILLTILNILHERSWLWAIAISFGVSAYLCFFQLPFAELISRFYCPQLAGATLLLLFADMFLPSSKAPPAWRWPLRGWAIALGFFALFSGILSYMGSSEESVAVPFAFVILGIMYLVYSIRVRYPAVGILFTVHAVLALVFWMGYYHIRFWLPILTGLVVLFFISGIILQRKSLMSWSHLFRWSGLALGGIVALSALWYHGNDRALYVVILASLFLLETFQNSWLELVPPLISSLALGMALFDGRVKSLAYYPAGIAFIFLGLDLVFTRLGKRRGVKWTTWVIAGLSAAITPIVVILPEFKPLDGLLVCICLTVLFVIQTMVYRRSSLGYAATFFFTLAALFADLNYFENGWLWTLTITAFAFYGLGILLRGLKQLEWNSVLRYSGLGLVSLTALSAPFARNGLIDSMPVAIAASLWAVEAFRRRNAWIGFPATGLYLMAYFMILSTLKVDQVQFHSVGTAILGMVMHYLLIKAGSKTGAFLTGMFSQLVLLSTTYIQMVSTENVIYFAVLFFQSLVVLAYGIVIRSRSLVITPIVMVVLGVGTMVFSWLRDISTVMLIGCTGICLILLGIAALLLRERITNLRDQIKGWRA